MLFQKTISSLPFSQWLISDKENKRLLWITAIVMIASFSWLKYMYPYPNFMPPDSYSYLEAANNNEFINMWPIGYSRFLRLISSFSNSHFVLVSIQYIILIATILYSLFTIRYLLSPGTWVFRILFFVSIGNPLLPHIANFVSSDCLFAALSLVWFTQLLWILHQPTKKTVMFHSVILMLAFTVRFMALYYPFFSITIIIFKQMPRKTKWLGIATTVLLLAGFIGCTQYEYKIKTGTIQYSAFGGWQLAANALYGYAYAKPDEPLTVPGKFRQLHTMVNRHMDSLRLLKNRPDKEIGIYYLWDLQSPLRVYMAQHWHNNSSISWFKLWSVMAPLYQQYGRWLIVQHPLEYARYYIWPNLIKYYAPPVKFMGSYNLESEHVQPIAVTWFGWSNNQLPVRSKDRIIHITNIFPTLLSIINPLFLLASIVFVSFKGLVKCNITGKQTLALLWLIWFGNMFFSVISAPTELRYQLFPIIITIPFCGLFINWIIQSLQPLPTTKRQQQLIPLPEPLS
jgi:hypothetical protein